MPHSAPCVVIGSLVAWPAVVVFVETGTETEDDSGVSGQDGPDSVAFVGVTVESDQLKRSRTKAWIRARIARTTIRMARIVAASDRTKPRRSRLRSSKRTVASHCQTHIKHWRIVDATERDASIVWRTVRCR